MLDTSKRGGNAPRAIPCEREASEATITDERYNRRVEEEAISKLERLGYPRPWDQLLWGGLWERSGCGGASQI